MLVDYRIGAKLYPWSSLGTHAQDQKVGALEGTGFVPGQTAVMIGDTTIPASQADIAADGTLLTFTTPRGSAGIVDIVVPSRMGPLTPFRSALWQVLERLWPTPCFALSSRQ